MTASSTIPANRPGESTGSSSATPTSRLSAIFTTVVVALQLGLLITVSWRFDVISRSFVYLSIPTFFGLMVDAQVQRSWRLGFFSRVYNAARSRTNHLSVA